jgi:hypothetical protein
MCDYYLFNCKDKKLKLYNSLLLRYNSMADMKIDPNRPKDDQALAGTTFQPTATPPAVDDQGKQLPLGPETLEKQRAGFQAAEQADGGTKQENPLEVKGVEADLQNAEQNPEASGPANRTKEDVQAQGQEVKADLQEQTDAVKSDAQAQQQEAPPPPEPEPKKVRGRPRKTE